MIGKKIHCDTCFLTLTNSSYKDCGSTMDFADWVELHNIFFNTIVSSSESDSFSIVEWFAKKAYKTIPTRLCVDFLVRNNDIRSKRWRNYRTRQNAWPKSKSIREKNNRTKILEAKNTQIDPKRSMSLKSAESLRKCPHAFSLRFKKIQFYLRKFLFVNIE